MNSRFSRFVPLWSEIRSLLESIYGRATTILSLLSPFIYLFNIPEPFGTSTKIMAGGAFLVIAANTLFAFVVPSVQRNYPKFLDYEKKCLELVKSDALDICEEYGQIVGKQINLIEWERTGHSFPYLSDKKLIPILDEYKKNFQEGQIDNKNTEAINKLKLARSLTTLKYVLYDTSHCFIRTVIAIVLFVGIAMIYGPQCISLLKWIF